MSENILFLTPQIPFPPQQGASLRNFYIIKGVAQGHRVDLLTFYENEQDQEPATIQPLLNLLDRFEAIDLPKRNTLDRLRSLFLSPLPDMGHRLYSKAFQARLIDWLQSKSYAVIQIEGIELARYIPIIRKHALSAIIVFDNHNAETDLQRRIYKTDLFSFYPKRWAKGLYSLIQVQKLDRFEKEVCQAADHVTAVSQADAALIQPYRRPGQTPVLSIPNVIDVGEWTRLSRHEKKQYHLLFMGKMDYRPNVDGVLWFMQTCWPEVLHRVPEIKFVIVGKNPSPEIEQLDKHPQIDVTGFVESIEPYVMQSDLMIMPLRMGSGTRLKLIQGLAAGIPIVSTTTGAEGVGARDREHLLLADTPERFVGAVVELLNDPSLQNRLCKNGKVLASAFDWRAVVTRFESLYAASDAST
ncbi:MAG: glycosyltransferase [Chloroflexota bacterium]